MRIVGPGSVKGPQGKRGVRPAAGDGADFLRHLEGGEAPQAATAAVPIGRPDALLSLQEVPDEAYARRQALRRGSDLLDRLDEIRLGLLVGSIPLARLKGLAMALKRERLQALDPNLAATLAEIELRCAVELAKLGQDGAGD